MKYLLWLVGLFAAAVAFAIASHSSAYVQFVYPPYRIEMSFTAFFVVSLLLFAVAYGLIRLMVSFFSLSSKVRKFRIEHARTKLRALMDEMLSAYFEGRYADAEKAAVRAIARGEKSALPPIIAARSAHELRQYKKRDAYLASSEEKKIGDSTMRLMATTKFMLEQHDSRAALNALQEMHNRGVKPYPGALSLELKVQQQAGNWDEVLHVLDQLEKKASIDMSVAAQMRQEAWQEKIRKQTDLPGVTSCLKNVPGKIKKSNKFAATAARALIQYQGSNLAQQLIRDSLEAQWDGELVVLYGDCLSDDLVLQTEQAEKWLKQHPQEPGLLLALGKLCIKQKLWGKAQNYLDASISLLPSHGAFEALGRLAEKMGKQDDAFRYFQQAMKIDRPVVSQSINKH